ncbi:MAG TPA: hypoxanthine phosphoribosyltransferase [Nitrospiria bacterium]|nr:hypoxanthine phosphoribosyltransferase [Nitrospiria bacterium]
MEKAFGRPILTQEEILKRIKELGNQITADFDGKNPVMIGVLKGAFPFYADLVRNIRLLLRVDFLVVSNRPVKDKSKGGTVKFLSDLSEDISGKDVVLVEDIISTGMTVSYVKKKLLAKKPKSLRVCTLLDKPERRKVRVSVDYVGFTIPNKYVVGYGLDYQNRYRNLPYIAVMDQVSEAEELFYWQE